MPFKSTPAHARLYVELPTAKQKLSDIKILLEAIRQMPIADSIKVRMLVHGIWEVARATGNFRGRYRSEGVIRTVGVRIQRDHIFKKSTLIERLFTTSPDLDKVIEQARCSIVTVDEHWRLHDVDNDLDGWDRYKAARVVVYDMIDETPVA
jgi:hypothetical protein